jgi:peptidyl-prolyl cis-trans isomerase D
MLKTMRKNFKSFAPALWIVIITFVATIFIYWGAGGFNRDEGETDTSSLTVAKVAGRKISGQQYANVLEMAIQQKSQQFGQDKLNKSLIQQLDLPNSTLRGLIQSALLLDLAKKRHIQVSDKDFQQEVRRRAPIFFNEKSGQFVGQKEYEQILTYNKVSIADFEKSVEDSIRLEKIQRLITASQAVTPEELWDSYRKDNETARLEYLVLEKDKVKLGAEPAAAEVQAYFESHKDEFRIPEKREAVYVFFDRNDLKKQVELSSQEIERYYQDNKDQFQNPEEINVSRIYIPFAGRNKDDVEAEMRGLTEQLGRGDDFAALAKTHSKDAKASAGGAWGPMEWRSLATREQNEIKKLSAGQVSGVVVLDDGLSLLKVTDKKEASPIPIEEARQRIKGILEDQKAQTLATERIGRLEKEAKKEGRLEKAAARLDLQAEKSGPLKKGDPLGQVDPSGVVSQAIFQLQANGISGPLYSYQGAGLAQLVTVLPAHPATLEEVRSDVVDKVTEIKKKEMMLSRLQRLRPQLALQNWEDLGAKEGLEIKTVNEHKRGQYLGTIGDNEEIDQLAFSLPLASVSEPVDFGDGYAVLRVLDRKEVTREDFEKNKETTRQALLGMKQNTFLGSFLSKLEQERKTKINYQNYLQVVSAILARYED